jgi:plasmid maintenance system antidote protein VapI
MTMKNPPHPGDLVKSEIVEALGLSVSKAAVIGVNFGGANPSSSARFRYI